MTYKILDLFCCAGGAGLGYHHAGFHVTGVDIDEQPRYPFTFIRADVMGLDLAFLRSFDAIHASPPCQGYTEMVAPGTVGAPRLIAAVRDKLDAAGRPYIIENVEGARSEMRGPVMLCGTMFDLGVDGYELQRHRLFESNIPISAPRNCDHRGPVVGVYGGHARCRSTKYGGRGTKDTWPRGHKGTAAAAMGITWATLAEMSEAIPPAYTEHLGRQLWDHLDDDILG